VDSAQQKASPEELRLEALQVARVEQTSAETARQAGSAVTRRGLDLLDRQSK
jgi:hypothetical protein